jgi:hypothetical protein
MEQPMPHSPQPPQKELTLEQMQDAAVIAFAGIASYALASLKGTPAPLMRAIGKLIAEAKYGDASEAADKHNTELLKSVKQQVRDDMAAEYAKNKGAVA